MVVSVCPRQVGVDGLVVGSGGVAKVNCAEVTLEAKSSLNLSFARLMLGPAFAIGCSETLLKGVGRKLPGRLFDRLSPTFQRRVGLFAQFYFQSYAHVFNLFTVLHH
jgi:hypothetical protein